MAYALRYLAVCAALLLAASGPLAQTAGRTTALRFTVFALRPIEGLGYITATGAVQPIAFSSLGRSPRYTYVGPGPMKFLDATTKEVVAEAVVPAEIREPLFLFLDPPANNPRKLRHQVAVLDDSVAKLGPGQLAILNLSSLKLTGTLDKTDLALESGLNAPVPVKSGAKLTLFTTARGSRVQSYANVLKPSKTGRLLLILFPPASKGALEVQARFLAEEPPSPAPPITVPLPKKQE